MIQQITKRNVWRKKNINKFYTIAIAKRKWYPKLIHVKNWLHDLRYIRIYRMKNGCFPSELNCIEIASQYNILFLPHIVWTLLNFYWFTRFVYAKHLQYTRTSWKYTYWTWLCFRKTKLVNLDSVTMNKCGTYLN